MFSTRSRIPGLIPVSLVKENHGVGLAVNERPDKVVTYTGQKLQVAKP